MRPQIPDRAAPPVVDGTAANTREALFFSESRFANQSCPGPERMTGFALRGAIAKVSIVAYVFPTRISGLEAESWQADIEMDCKKTREEDTQTRQNRCIGDIQTQIQQPDEYQ